MVGVLAQKWIKVEKAKREKMLTADQVYKNLEKKAAENAAEVVAEMDKRIIEQAYKLAEEKKNSQ